jgi:hypothetical protein
MQEYVKIEVEFQTKFNFFVFFPIFKDEDILNLGLGKDPGSRKKSSRILGVKMHRIPDQEH